MSSAALQQPSSLPALSTHSPATASPSHRQYTPGQSPSREASYYAGRDNNSQTASPSTTSRRPSRKPSDSYPELTQSSPMASRTALASPVAVTAGTPDASLTPTSSSRRHRDREAPIAPPRTSSTQQQTSRRAARAEERAANSPRRHNGESSRNDDPNGNVEPSRAAYEAAIAAASRTRQEPRSSRSREERQAAPAPANLAIRPQGIPSTASSSKQPSREASEVLNRVIVSQPEVDIGREQERLDESQPHSVPGLDDPTGDEAAPPPVVPMPEPQPYDETRRGGRSRHDHSKREKGQKFGDYYLGNTIGEGEFGKVKLGWKQDGGVQVAIKLIRRDSVGNNPNRLQKIYREVSILKTISHPNIVRLHEMSETERHIGIVLEYASGGELFDYILNHRYLKDNAARRLFAQLVSGVGYLHKKGIVHRDLKLENLLLDRNRNIIITDFGFANTFEPFDELTEEEELGLSDRDFVKRVGLDRTKANGMRRGDLMQTSCGSPCYAAPELVVSDSLYTGRKVDVWSCGVILYAMLAGYLPFDDDPANPEGDNINLLYKYIVNTPLTFPEYVTPHARDLLRRILVPNPRKRADLFEVARHSWLSEYAHVVGFITSETTTPSEIQNTTVPAEDAEVGGMARSASVRVASSKTKPTPAAVGDLARKPGTVDGDDAGYAKAQKESKRRTVQVEYVAPTTQTTRGNVESPESQATPRGKTRARSSSQGPTEVQASPADKPLPRDPPVSREAYAGSPGQSRQRPPSAHRNQNGPPVSRVPRDPPRPISESVYSTSGARPATGGSMASNGSRVPGRASYAQPLPPAVADTNAHGRIQQPSGSSDRSGRYTISNPIQQESPDMEFGRPSVSVPPKFAQVSGFNDNPDGAQPPSAEARGHRRSNTIGEIGGKIFGRSGSIFGGRKKREEPPTPTSAAGEKRKYPPVSLSNTMPGSSAGPRQSMDSRASRRSFSQSLGIGKKRSGSMSGSGDSTEKVQQNPRRFSIMRAMGLGKDQYAVSSDQQMGSQPDLPIQDPPATDEYGRYIETSQPVANYSDGTYDGTARQQQRMSSAPATNSGNGSPAQHRRYESTSAPRASAVPAYLQQSSMLNSGSESSLAPQPRPPRSAPYQSPAANQSDYGYDSAGIEGGHQRTGSRGAGRVLQKNKKFSDYEGEPDGFGYSRDHAGSSGAAKRVMGFFRRMGKARGGEA